jgi:hypothetical protein
MPLRDGANTWAKMMPLFPRCDIETGTNWMRLSVAAPLPNGNGTGGGGHACAMALLLPLQYKSKAITHRTSCQIRIRRMSCMSCNERITAPGHHSPLQRMEPRRVVNSTVLHWNGKTAVLQYRESTRHGLFVRAFQTKPTEAALLQTRSFTSLVGVHRYHTQIRRTEVKQGSD